MIIFLPIHPYIQKQPIIISYNFMKAQRTSQTHPIQLGIIGEIWPGKLGITFAPGKVQKNALTGTWSRNLDKDLERIRKYYQMEVLVCLLEKEEMRKLEIPHLLDQCKKFGLQTQWIQVRDNTVSKQEEKYKNLVKKVVDQYLKKGKNVVVHCKGGLGRAGTFAASCLIYNGFKPQDAIKFIRKTRKDTINCQSQQQWLYTLKF